MKNLFLSLIVMCSAFSVNAQTAIYADIEVHNTTGVDKYLTIFASQSSCSPSFNTTYFIPAAGTITILGPTNGGVRFTNAIITDLPPMSATIHLSIHANTMVPWFSGAGCPSPTGLPTIDAGVLDSGAFARAEWSNITDPVASTIVISC